MDEPSLDNSPDNGGAAPAPGGQAPTIEDQTTQRARDRSDAWYEQSLLHFQKGEWQEASAGFEEVLRLRPDSPWADEANRQLAHMGIAARLAAPPGPASSQP